MRKIFYTIFGEDILIKEFDADMYKGGAYIEVIGDIAYIIEVSWECDTLRLVKLSNVSIETLFDLLVEKTDDYYTIGEIYVAQRRKDFSEKEKIKRMLQLIYDREVNWILEDSITSECYNIECENGKWKWE